MAFDDSIVLGVSKAVSAALSNNTTNYWRVNAKNSSGTSAWSSIWGFTTIPAIPAIPVLIAPSNAASNLDAEQTLTWSTVTGATGYRVQVSTCSNFETTVSDDSTLTVGTKAIAGLEKGTMYYWRVNAMNAGGTSSWTVPWYFIVDTLIATDADGNIYHTITIGTQIWTVENLKTTKYNDGTAITLVTDSADWTNRITPGYCWYNNDSIVNKNMYGALYNWYAASVKNLAPGGWHVPTRSEWDTLRTYLLTHGYNWDGSTNGNKVSKAMAAQTIWSTYSQIGVIGNDMASNNRSGFSALPGGCRLENSDFYDIRNYSSWWSVDMPRYIYLHFDCEFFGTGTSDKRCGFSIRLVKN